MPTSFPGSVDTFPTAVDLANDTLATKPHSTLHGNLGDALVAVETYAKTHASTHEEGGADPITNLGNATALLDLDPALAGLLVSITGYNGSAEVVNQWNLEETFTHFQLFVDPGNQTGAPVNFQISVDGFEMNATDAPGNPKFATYMHGMAANGYRFELYDQADLSVMSDLLTIDAAGITLESHDASGQVISDSLLSHTPSLNRLVFRNADLSEHIALRDDETGLVISNVGGVAQHQLGDALVGFFAKTPYGQDAYEDPSTITPETLANYQIARGWMAAA